MHSPEMLKSMVQSFACVPSGAEVCVMEPPVEGPGGKWQAAIWITAFNQFVAVVIPWGGGYPVAYGIAWSDAERAIVAARGFACIAAEVETAKV